MRRRLTEAGVIEDGRVFVEDEEGGSGSGVEPEIAVGGSEEENGEENGMLVVGDAAAAGVAAAPAQEDAGEGEVA